MKLKTLILSLLISLNSTASEELFTNANNAYSNSNYTEAIALYDSIISTELESSELYFNLGNCYYQNKDWANAIWNYEKSLKLKKEAKTLENLSLAQLRIIDKIEPLPQLFYSKWWHQFISIFNTLTWQILALFFIWLILIIKILSLFTNSKKEHFLQALILISFILFLSSYYSIKENHSKKEGIIFTSAVVVNSAPSTNSTNLFTLHSGSKVEITDSIGEWINIKIANGNTGWILQNSVKEL